MLDINHSRLRVTTNLRQKPLKLFSWPYLSWREIQKSDDIGWNHWQRHPTHLRRAKKLRASSASSASWPKDLGDLISYSGTAVTMVCLQARVPLWVLLVPWYKEAKRNKRSQCVPVSRKVQMLPLLFQAGMKMFVTGFHISTILHCPNALPPRQCTATMFVLRVACQVKTTESSSKNEGITSTFLQYIIPMYYVYV